jgi:hypothetical protein
VSHAFLLCRRCGVLHPFPQPLDEDDALDLAQFRAGHEAHTLERATRVADSALFDGPPWDPMSARWLQVTAGNDVFVVRSWRRSVAEPRRHEITSRPPSVTDCVEVDAAAVRWALDRHFYPHALAPVKLERFVGALHELLADLDPLEVETSFDDATVANASIGPLPDAVCDALLARAAAIFHRWELERVRGFVAAHRYEDGVLAVRVRRVLSRSAA